MTTDLPVFTIHRSFNAPRSLVWKAWTDPKMVAQWFGPKGSECTILKHDLQVGGVVHSRITMPGAPAMYGKFTFREITPESLLSWFHSFSDEGGVKLTRHPMAPTWPLELITTVTFTARGDQTDITLTWVPHNASPQELETFQAGIEGMNQGWGGGFEQLDVFLAQAAAA